MFSKYKLRQLKKVGMQIYFLGHEPYQIRKMKPHILTSKLNYADKKLSHESKVYRWCHKGRKAPNAFLSLQNSNLFNKTLFNFSSKVSVLEAFDPLLCREDEYGEYENHSKLKMLFIKKKKKRVLFRKLILLLFVFCCFWHSFCRVVFSSTPARKCFPKS